MLSSHNWYIGFRSMILLGSLAATLGSTSAQDFTLHDDFNDGDVTEATGGGHWVQGVVPVGATMDASSGDLVFNTPSGFMDAHLVSFDGVTVPERSEWSFRARMTVQSGDFGAVGTTVFNHAALIPFARDEGLEVGTGNNDISRTGLPYSHYGEEVIIQMDTFDGMVTGYVWKDGDSTPAVQLSRPYTPVPTLPNFGVARGGPGIVTIHEAWVSTTPLPIIPEPSTLALAGLGLVPMLSWKRRRLRN